MEKEIKIITKKMEDNLYKFNEQLLKKHDDILFLKESCNEQKTRIDLEHEMLSNCLFDMSMQFISLRNEMFGKFV